MYLTATTRIPARKPGSESRWTSTGILDKKLPQTRDGYIGRKPSLDHGGRRF